MRRKEQEQEQEQNKKIIRTRKESVLEGEIEERER
jgi:hypothetical protein